MEKKSQKKEIKLKVAEALQDDVNKGIVRIDSSYLHELGIRPGDIVEIEDKRRTVAIVDRAYPGDIGLNIIRMDGIIRRNAKTGIGEFVKIRKAEVKEAQKIIIGPARKDIIIKASPNIFKHGLLGRAVMKGDIVSLGGVRRRKSTMSQNPFFDDIFNMLDEASFGFGFSDLKFIVAEVMPKNTPVIITESTEIIFNPEAVEIKEEEAPEVTYEDIGGLEEEIKKIREMVELPLKHPEIFERLGIEPPKGVLLHGPPGTGKTLLAKAVANETNANFLVINGPEIMSKYYGQSEENLRKKFEEAERNAPSIIFIDEIDAIASKREETKGEVERRVVAQLLALMDGLKSRGKVIVIAATNIPNALDPALRRPGRFDRELEIGVPGYEGRLNILKIHTRNMPFLGTLYDDLLASVIIDYIDKYLDKHKKELEEIEYKINQLKNQAGKEDSFNKLKNKFLAIEKKIEKLETLKEINKKKKSLEEIVKILKSIEHKKELWDNYDARRHFLEEKKNKYSQEIWTNLEFLLNEDIIPIEEIFEKAHNLGKERDFKRIAEITYGFVGADLAALAKEAAMIVLRRVLPNLDMDADKPIPNEILEKLKITQKDFFDALKVVRPSAMREVLVEIPNVHWEDIGGLEEVKEELKEAVEWPLKKPEVFKRLGINPPKGVLLYGPPGTGKTMLAKAVANESKANFILVKGPELLSKWVGESEKAVREIFKKARQTSPTIIFFDEIDALAPRRNVNNTNDVMERVVNQLLTEIDGLEALHNVIIMGATNRPDMLDTALLRPGRFDRIVLTPAPNEKEREEIFKVHTKDMPLAKDVDIKELAKRTKGYAGADIEGLCREAAMFALRKNIATKEVSKEDFEKALEKVRPSITEDIEKSYAEIYNYFRAAKGKQMTIEKPAYFG